MSYSPGAKVNIGNETIIDLTQDTVSPGTLKKGVTAHNRSGAQIVGIAADKYVGMCEASLDSSGSSSAIKKYTGTITGVTEYEAGMAVAVRFASGLPAADNLTVISFNLNSLGDKHISYHGESLGASYKQTKALVPAGWVALLVLREYDNGGTTTQCWELLNAEKATNYGVCSTAASTQTKTVIIPGITELYEGLSIRIKFSSENTASQPKLNVNSLGACYILNGNSYAGNTAAQSWKALGIVELTYIVNGGTGYWAMNYYANSTYSNASLGQTHGTCDTAESTTEKAVTSANYKLGTGSKISVEFTYAVPASATLNVNSTGAKNIYYKGSAITAGIIQAGDIALFVYDGTQFILLSIDRVACEAPSTGGGGVPYGTCSALNGDFYKDVIVADFAGQTDIPYGTIFTVNFANGICGDEMLRINNGTQNMTINGSSGSAYDGSIAFPLRNPPAKMTPDKQCILEVVAAYDTENMQVALFVTGAKQAIAPVKYGVYNYGSVSFSGYSQNIDIWNTDLIIIRFDAAPTSGTWTGPWTGYYTSITAYKHGTAVASGDIESGDTCLFRPRRIGATWRLDMLANDRLL